jgi:2-C-methyl-D-erythritol 4-phosphate cytidylyltransferase
MSHSETAVVIPAAGSGERLGVGIPKALVEVGGRTLIERAAQNLSSLAADIFIAAPAGYEDNFREIFAQTKISSHVTVITGGSTRSQSVANALKALPLTTKYVLIHDAARAFAPADLAESILVQLSSGENAVVPALDVVDTIKEVDERGYVIQTPKRDSLRAVQTPQGFTFDKIIAAHASGADATDDAALVAALGVPVRVVPGSPLARKITTLEDLTWAQELVGK